MALAWIYSPEPAHRARTQRLHSPTILPRSARSARVPRRARMHASHGEHQLSRPDRAVQLANRHTHPRTPTVYTCTVTPCTTRTHTHQPRGPGAPDASGSRPYTRQSSPMHRRGLFTQQRLRPSSRTGTGSVGTAAASPTSAASSSPPWYQSLHPSSPSSVLERSHVEAFYGTLP